MTNTSITERAMLVRLSISSWSATKLDKKVTKEVADKHGVAQDRGRYSKALVAKEQLEDVRKLASEFRTWHYEQTLPWDDEAYRILPAKNFLTYRAESQGRQDKLRAAMDQFIARYPEYRAEAKQALNGLFNDADYPTPAELEKKFAVEVKIKPMPDAADFRVDIGDEAADAIRAEIAKSTRDAIAAGMKDAWQRLYDAVAHMAERLKAYGTDSNGAVVGAFRNTLVTNLKDLCDVLPRLNLLDDPKMDELVAAVRRALIVDPDDLRESASVRRKTAASADAILAQMKEFVA